MNGKQNFTLLIDFIQYYLCMVIVSFQQKMFASLKIPEIIWKSLKLFGNPWKSFKNPGKPFGNLWKSLRIIWKFLKLFRNPWKSFENLWKSRISFENHSEISENHLYIIRNPSDIYCCCFKSFGTASIEDKSSYFSL